MFIKLIQIYHQFDVSLNQNRWRLREMVINKKYIVNMVETSYFYHVDKNMMPQELNQNQRFVHINMDGEKDGVYIVGDLDHIYKLLETDSALNYRQTLRG